MVEPTDQGVQESIISNEVPATTVEGKRIVRFYCDVAGRMAKMSDSGSGGTSFSDTTTLYDDMVQLTEVTHPDDKTITYDCACGDMSRNALRASSRGSVLASDDHPSWRMQT